MRRRPQVKAAHIVFLTADPDKSRKRLRLASSARAKGTLDDSCPQLASGLVPALLASLDETDYRCSMKTTKTNKLRRATEADYSSSFVRLCL
jgi:hypothetical protein